MTKSSCNTCGLFISKEIMCPKNRREMETMGADGACGHADISFVYRGVIYIRDAKHSHCGKHELPIEGNHG